jgi:hypothetical protein
MLSKQLIFISICLMLSMIPFTLGQFSYSANWGKRSNSIEKIDSIEKSAENFSPEENLEENSNIMDILMSHEKVRIALTANENVFFK